MSKYIIFLSNTVSIEPVTVNHCHLCPFVSAPLDLFIALAMERLVSSSQENIHNTVDFIKYDIVTVRFHSNGRITIASTVSLTWNTVSSFGWRPFPRFFVSTTGLLWDFHQTISQWVSSTRRRFRFDSNVLWWSTRHGEDDGGMGVGREEFRPIKFRLKLPCWNNFGKLYAPVGNIPINMLKQTENILAI